MSVHLPDGFIADRLWTRVEKTDGCWLWTGPTASNGYGRLAVTVEGRRTTIGAHRASYELLVGPVADDLDLDHLCRVRNCVRPNHLEPVPSRVNTMRGTAPTAINAARTACVHGHDFTVANTIRLSDGRRRCRTCQNRMSLAAYHRRRATAAGPTAAEGKTSAGVSHQHETAGL